MDDVADRIVQLHCLIHVGRDGLLQIVHWIDGFRQNVVLGLVVAARFKTFDGGESVVVEGHRFKARYLKGKASRGTGQLQ